MTQAGRWQGHLASDTIAFRRIFPDDCVLKR